MFGGRTGAQTASPFRFASESSLVVKQQQREAEETSVPISEVSTCVRFPIKTHSVKLRLVNLDVL